MRQQSLRLRSVYAAMGTLALVLGSVAPSQAAEKPSQALITVTYYGGFVMPGTDQSSLPALSISPSGLAITPSENPRRYDIRTAMLRQVSLERVNLLLKDLAAVSTPPKGGWGFPGVADVPNTRIVISAPHIHRKVTIYALAFSNGGNLTSAQVKARKALNSAYNKLYKYVQSQKATEYKPTAYEAWNGMALVMGKVQGSKGTGVGGGTGLANPASVFCTSMGGELSIVDKPEGQVGMCALQDGTTVEEWAYYRAESPKLGQWPSTIPAPKAACTVVTRKQLASQLNRSNESGRWLLPDGSVAYLMFRPVLPGEKACQR